MESMSSVYCHQNAIVGEYLKNLPSKYPFLRNSILSFFPQHRPHHSSTPPRGLWPASTSWCGWRAPTWSCSQSSSGHEWPEAQPLCRSQPFPCPASANRRATAERAVFRDGESECKIIDLWFWVKIIMIWWLFFRRQRMKAASWLLAECVGCQVLLELRSGSSLGCILAACSVDSCVRLLVKQDILIMIEPVFMSTFGCFILSEQSFTSKQEQIYRW